MNYRMLLLALLSLALPAAAVGQQAPRIPDKDTDVNAEGTLPPAEREKPPKAADPKESAPPAATRFNLDNRLAVTLVPFGSVPKVTIELSVLAGNAYEEPEQIWLADLTASLLREGTERRSATQLSEDVARMGGTLDVTTSPDRIEITGEALSEFAPEMARLVAEVAVSPRLPDSELARLKTDLLRRLDIARSQPQQLAEERFRALLYPGHAYGRVFPTPEMLGGYTIEQVRSFHVATFGAARSRLYVAGRFDAGEMEAAIREGFRSWRPGPEPEERPPSPETDRAVYLIDRPGAVQSTLLLGVPVIAPSHPDYVPLIVTNTLLGGYFSSRITTNIREQKGYTYSPFSQLSERHRDSYWAETADVTTEFTGASLKEIFDEIDRLQAEPPSLEELRAVQNYLAGVFVLVGSSRAGIINQLQRVDYQDLPEDYLRTYVTRLFAVKPDEVQHMARDYLRDEEITIVVVGDREVVEEQVREFGELR